MSTEIIDKIRGTSSQKTRWNSCDDDFLKNMQQIHNIFGEEFFYARGNFKKQRIFFKWAKQGFSTMSLKQKETHCFSGKEKVSGVAVSKENDVDSLLGHKKTHHYWFL